MKEAIISYLELVNGPQLPAEGRLAALASALDRLAHAMAAVADAPAEEDREPPHIAQSAVLGRVRANFPELGSYPWADPLGNLDFPELVSDAADDAADIAQDLAESLWRFDHLGEADAHWHLTLHFRVHWGRHLFNLRSYLHALINES